MCGNLTRLKIDHKLEKYEMKSISLTSVYSGGSNFFHHIKSNIYEFMDFLEKP